MNTNQHRHVLPSEWAKNGLSSSVIGPMTSRSSSNLNTPPKGRIFSILNEEPRDPLHWLAMLNHELNEQIYVFSRLSPQRLGQHIRLDKIEFKWLSESMDVHALSPSLERIHHAISTRIATDGGIIWLDAVEFLIHRQGFDSFLSFTRSLADELNGTDWCVLLPFSPLSIDGTEIAHLRREAVPFGVDFSITPQSQDVEEIDDENANETDESVTEEVPDSVESESSIIQFELKMLSSIAEVALSPAVLNRRIEQWEDMGFDVSDLDHAINSESAVRYAIYRDVEERIRRAIECEKRIQMIEVRGHTVEATKMRFRIMQLTGLDDVESDLNEILEGKQV